MPDNRSGLAATYHNLGAFYERTGQIREAGIAYKEAIGLWKALVEKYPESPEYRLRLAESYNGLGDVHKTTGRAKQAEEAHKEAEAIRKQLADEQTKTPTREDPAR
jgi:tetratricopeptide (TPR) repeat protein